MFDIGEASLKRIPMMEPLLGTEAVVRTLLDTSPEAADLIEALGDPDE